MAFFTNHFANKVSICACVAFFAAAAVARHLVCFSAVRLTIKALHVAIACSLIFFFCSVTHSRHSVLRFSAQFYGCTWKLVWRGWIENFALYTTPFMPLLLLCFFSPSSYLRIILSRFLFPIPFHGVFLFLMAYFDFNFISFPLIFFFCGSSFSLHVFVCFFRSV